jgi:hypothetical protein
MIQTINYTTTTLNLTGDFRSSTGTNPPWKSGSFFRYPVCLAEMKAGSIREIDDDASPTVSSNPPALSDSDTGWDFLQYLQ